MRLGLLVAIVISLTSHALGETQSELIEHGKYVATIAGCNDCHTTGFAPSGGQVPVEKWLMGDAVGWRGPWGTTYPINLRLFFSTIGEEEWVKFARTRTSRPPMPSYVLQKLNDKDLRAIYHLVKSLGAAGEKAPEYLPPGVEPKTPFFLFEPQMPKGSITNTAK